MTRITTPARLDDYLGQSALGHGVRLYAEQFERWLGDDTSGLYFFPEYTDHGPRHISSVLAAAETLIRAESWSLLTSEDVAVLILATLLHDSAMHLTTDGLLDLLNPEHTPRRPLIDQLDTKTWPQLFDDYFAEARRWDQRKLHKILGDEHKPAEYEDDLIDTIRRPSEMAHLDPEKWTLRFRKFLGEFVRRHHARLAHEIVLHGVPGDSAGILKPPADLDRIADLAGLVARSHNMNLRALFGYLEKRYWGRITCRDSHPVFLMVLLRIADYLEIRADRVNPTLLEIQRLRSPISREEQDSHLDIDEVRPDEHDEEAVFVIARPRSARSFLKLQRLLRSLQEELDTSWAVLGEVFSRDNKLRELGLNLRRVRSNLDDQVEFVAREQPPYFPIKAAFDAAGADLLKLLIKPLYGDRPEIGIRELLQNSLDAVHELRQYEADHKWVSDHAPNQTAKVVIAIAKDAIGRDWLTVSDKGIGMTEDTVCAYFLRAGASFRESDAWKRDFEHEGSSKVLRSGRFGIGALAAFLLGDRLELFTRHIEAEPSEGVYLSASLQDDEIELKRVERPEPGTEIRVLLSKESAARFQTSIPFRPTWDWYAFTDPQVERILYGRGLRQRYGLPDHRGSAIPNDWSRISTSAFPSILWTYSPAPAFSCNGIIVSDQRTLSIFADPHIVTPRVSFIDPNGKLPLTLQRDNLITNKIAAADDILRDVVCDLYAFLLAHLPSDPLRAELVTNLQPYLKKDTIANWIWLTANGAILAHPALTTRAGINRALVVVSSEKVIHLAPERFEADAYFTVSQKHWRSLQEQLFSSARYTTQGLSVMGRRGAPGPHKVAPIKVSDDWQIWNERNVVGIDALTRLAAAIDLYRRVDILAIGYWTFAPRASTNSLCATIIDDLTDTPFIPLDLAERISKLSGAFGKLDTHLRAWLSSELVGWRRSLLDRLEADSSGSRVEGRVLDPSQWK